MVHVRRGTGLPTREDETTVAHEHMAPPRVDPRPPAPGLSSRPYAGGPVPAPRPEHPRSASSAPDPRRDRRLHHVFEATCHRTPHRVAVECEGERYTYAELDRRANQLAHLLLRGGLPVGARVAILLHRSLDTYVALLAVGKAGAAFVPIDPSSPADRVTYIGTDADVALVVTSSELVGAARELGRPTLELDRARPALAAAPSSRPRLAVPPGSDPTAYVIYTSGSSGRPKGVEVAQSSIVNFLDVVPRLYDVRPTDRVYQGMTVSFDFSIEEIWPTWAVGAALVAGPNDSRRLGGELADFLDEQAVTVLYLVPTLLATIPRELPDVRTILVGGEACPGELVDRWSRPGRRILNTYGPTEATVTATWCDLYPGKPVTIGRPLPTYSVVILDEHRNLVADGEVGEICIGGPGVARGYVGRPDLTADRFVEHALAPVGGRLYRTGDLGRLTPDGEIEYRGRADAEVKIRGHRVDLGEIESVLLEDDDVGAAVAALVPVGGSDELTAYVTVVDGTDRTELTGRLHEQLSSRLPEYMVPSFLDVLDALPTMPSGKVDRTRLPEPSGRRLLGTSGPVVAAAGAMERRVAEVWSEVLGLEVPELSVEADFFAGLGGHSLLAATVISRMRERGVGRSPAVGDLYAHPSVRALAAHLVAAADEEPPAPAVPREEPIRHTRGRVARAGTAQAAALYVLMLVVTLPISAVYTWNDGEVSVEVLAQFLGATVATYFGVRWLLPLLVIRPLSAGIGTGRYPLWGATYFRLWVMDLVLALAPTSVLSGSPMMGPYLRLLGARVGRRCHIATATVALPRQISLGRDVSIGYGVDVRPWRVEDGWVVVAPITVGVGGTVGANAVLEPGATVGNRAVLGEQSVLGRGESVPAAERWAGSPPVRIDHLAEGPADATATMMASTNRRGWAPGPLLAAAAGLVGLEVAAVAMIVPAVAVVWTALLLGNVLWGLAATLLAGPVFVVTVCLAVGVGRRLVLPHTPPGIHPVRSGLGVRKWVADKLFEFSLAFTNSLYATLYTVPWLRALGARVGRGAEVSTAAHLDPDLLTLGRDSFVADMASIGSATFANGHVAFAPTSVGSRAFVGNAAFVPAGSSLGDGSLVGVQTVPPSSGVPEDSSWLGSPAIHLPVRQDSGDFDEAETFHPPRRVVAHRWAIEFFRITLPASVLGIGFYLYLLALSALADGRDLLPTALLAPVLAFATSIGIVLWVAAVKRNVVGVYRPRVEPLWSRFVRRSEFVTGLYEAAAVPALLTLLVGTPFLPVVLRLFGAHIGARTWFGTTYLTEFDLVHVHDDATIGTGVSLQTHLFEDRVMKMSTVTIGEGATVGTRAIVLYDAVVGPQVSLDALSLLMKGEQLADGSQWRGIPAQAAAA
jgi:non-ribosomal peptide synthetase-like protein